MSDRSNRRLLWFSATNLGFVVILWLLEVFVAERHWLTTLITYSPQHWVGLPLLVLIPWALVRRSRWAIWLNVVTLLVFVSALLGFEVAHPCWQRSSPSVRVMTWNIHHASGGMDKVMSVVKREHPDVVCFQEANDGYWKSDVLPELRKAFRGWHCSEFREVATFSRYPIITQSVHRLMPETGRVVLETVIEVNGERLTVYNVHLNVAIAGRSLSKSGLRGIPNYLRHTADVRLDQVRDMKKVVATTTSALVVGDFNTPPRGRCYRWMAGRYQDAFPRGGLGFGYTYPTRHPLMRIDYIFASGGMHVRRCFVPRAAASDHRPVVADLVMPRKER